MTTCKCVYESHMTLNKFQMLIALQSMITDGIGLERRSFDLTYLSLLNRLQPTVEIQLGVVHFVGTPSV